jgi:hypothetical protein
MSRIKYKLYYVIGELKTPIYESVQRPAVIRRKAAEIKGDPLFGKRGCKEEYVIDKCLSK